MNRTELEQILRRCWSPETSADPAGWTNSNPSVGQCAVTALVVQDYLGGDIVWAAVPVGQKTVSHYFNRIDGKEIDLTREQFAPGTQVPAGVEKRKEFASTRDYVLSFEATQRRYAILKERVARIVITT